MHMPLRLRIIMSMVDTCWFSVYMMRPLPWILRQLYHARLCLSTPEPFEILYDFYGIPFPFSAKLWYNAKQMLLAAYQSEGGIQYEVLE